MMESFGKKPNIALELSTRINQKQKEIDKYKDEIAMIDRQIATIKEVAKKYEHTEAQDTADGLINNLENSRASYEMLIEENQREIADWQKQFFDEADEKSAPN